MPNFDYTATHDDGRTVSGTASGDTIQVVIQNLALQGLLVEKIQPVQNFSDPIPAEFTAPSRVERPLNPVTTPVYDPSTVPSAAPLRTHEGPAGDRRSYFQTNIWGPLAGTIPLTDLMNFFRQFAAMENAGVPRFQSLATLIQQTRHPKLQRIVREMAEAAQSGQPVSAPMQRYPEVFSPMMISLLRAGEEGGFVVKSLQQIAMYIEQEVQLRNLYRKATLYPKSVIFSSIGIIFLANTIIASLGQSNFIYSPLTQANILIVAIGIVVGLFLYFRIGLANPRIRYNWDGFLLHVPYLGPTLHQFAMAKFGRALAALYDGGVPVARSVQLSADACGNEYLRSKIYPAGPKLEQGDGLAGTLAATGALAPVAVSMLQTGETSGNVEGMLSKTSDYFEEEAKSRAHQLATITGVLCLIAVAVYVGFIVIHFFVGQAGAAYHSAMQPDPGQ
jgi:type II secretory pathway component PulF